MELPKELSLDPNGITWVTCWAGPGDGEPMPLDPTDPDLRAPYVSLPDNRYYWYVLQVHDTGAIRYVLEGVPDFGGWVTVLE